MDYIKGNIRSKIFQADSGFFVGTFKIKETTDESLLDKVNKTVTITGILLEPNEEESYLLYGTYQRNERYGYQYAFTSYEKVKPEGKDAVIEFLSSNLIKGCGERTAKKIVELFGERAIDIIKEDRNNLFLVPNMTELRADKIYTSLIEYSQVDDTLIALKKLGFTVNEATAIVKKYHDKTMMYVEENLYLFKDFVDFDKLDRIYKEHHDPYDMVRLLACTLETMESLSEKNGDIYYFEEEILDYLKQHFQLFLSLEDFATVLSELEQKHWILKKEEKIFLKRYEDMEQEIAAILYRICSHPKKQVKNYEDKIARLQEELEVQYNEEQKAAIYRALKNRVSIISGGPGTGKTTIVKAITKLYIELYQLSPIEVYTSIALIAPTGRAAKKLAMSTTLPASTIHRYLKWNKETNDFQVNESNKNHHKLIIVDETSMMDTYLLYSLLNGIEEDVQLIFVGDTFQLPSVGPGLILNDLVESGYFAYSPLKTIYRQSENSYIPFLAKEIKEKQLSDEYREKKDDYNFLVCDNHNLKQMLKQICERSIEKGIQMDDIQILAPMYKGENGIDNLNLLMQNLFNPPSEEKNEVLYYETTYREHDKVLQLVNNPDCNVYNGDIGHIESITEVTVPKKSIQVTIDFDGNKVVYQKEDLGSIKHAYAMTIHKSQGSEFPHVILPISKNYYKMLYNKLIYTGVSRAKKSLVILGDEASFLMAIQNDYSKNRKTDLKSKLWNKFAN